jgi:hypothetical protein
LTVGVDIAIALAAAPQAPSTRVWVWALAEQLTLTPPPEPTQLHIHGPEPWIEVGVPVLQRSCDGADRCIEPLVVPHDASTSFGAKQDTLPLPLSQVQFHGPSPSKALGFPATHKDPDGAVAVPCPAAAPQAGFSSMDATGVAGAANGAGISFACVFVDAVFTAASPKLPAGERVEQLVVWPDVSAQVQLQGPSPFTAPA